MTTEVTDTAPPEPGERGRLRIDPVVVRKIAQHAADEAPGTTITARRKGSSAQVTGEGDEISLRLELALIYPAPVRDVVAGVRSAVVETVERITSYRVRGIDVTVTALLPRILPRVQ